MKVSLRSLLDSFWVRRSSEVPHRDRGSALSMDHDDDSRGAVAALPHDDLHAALPDDHPAHATIERLRSELASSAPNRQAVEQHLEHLRSVPHIKAAIAAWWDDPRTQRAFATLGRLGS